MSYIQSNYAPPQGDASAPARADGESSPDHDGDDSDTSDAEDGDGAAAKPKAKRHRRSAGGDSRVTRRRQRLLHRHAMSVGVEVRCGDGTVLHHSFYHLTALGIVSVEVRLTLGPV